MYRCRGCKTVLDGEENDARDFSPGIALWSLGPEIIALPIIDILQSIRLNIMHNFQGLNLNTQATNNHFWFCVSHCIRHNDYNLTGKRLIGLYLGRRDHFCY